MAGHSQFKNIMHRKGAQDKKRAKVFAKHSREIMVAVKQGGEDPEANPRLRNAIKDARADNMPNDRVDKAIKSALGADADAHNYENIRYEGYGSGGVAIIIEALTDNRNRTASDLRAMFSRNGGNLGETGSVAFMFQQKGEILYPLSVADEEEIFEAAAEAGAENVESTEAGHEILTGPDDYGSVRDTLEARYGEPERAGLVWRPDTLAPADREIAEKVLKLIDALEENDDVQRVFTNVDIDQDTYTQLMAQSA